MLTQTQRFFFSLLQLMISALCSCVCVCFAGCPCQTVMPHMVICSVNCVQTFSASWGNSTESSEHLNADTHQYTHTHIRTYASPKELSRDWVEHTGQRNVVFRQRCTVHRARWISPTPLLNCSFYCSSVCQCMSPKLWTLILPLCVQILVLRMHISTSSCSDSWLCSLIRCVWH